jgi:hypothetical protein
VWRESVVVDVDPYRAGGFVESGVAVPTAAKSVGTDKYDLVALLQQVPDLLKESNFGVP